MANKKNIKLNELSVLIAAGKDKEALKLVSIDDFDGFFELCATAGNSKDCGVVMKLLDLYFETYTPFSDLWMDKALKFYGQGRHKAVIYCCDRVIEIDPRDERAWQFKGRTFASLGKSNEAIECYNKAIEVEDQDADAFNLKGLELSKLGRHEEALECQETALCHMSDSHEFLLGKAIALDGLGRYEEAKKYYKEAEKQPPHEIYLDAY